MSLLLPVVLAFSCLALAVHGHLHNEKDQAIAVLLVSFAAFSAFFRHYHVLPIPRLQRSQMPLSLDPYGYLSRVLALWILPFMVAGKIDKATVPDGCPDAKGSTGRYAPAAWREDLKVRWDVRGRRPGTLLWVSLEMLWPGYWKCQVLKILEKVLSLCQPFIIVWIMRFAEEEEPWVEGLRILIVVVLVQFLSNWSFGCSVYMYDCDTYMPTQLGLQTLTMDQTFRLDAVGWKKSSAGEVQELERLIVNGLDGTLLFGPLMEGPLDSVRVIFILRTFWLRMGVLATATGVLAGVACMGLNEMLQKKVTELENSKQAGSAERQNVLNTLTEYLTQWTMYGWTGFFVDRVRRSSAAILELNRSLGFIQGLRQFTVDSVAPLVVFSVLGVGVLYEGKSVTLQVLFELTLQSAQLQIAARTIMGARAKWADLVRTFDKVESFLLLPVDTPLAVTKDPITPFAVELSGADIGWPTLNPSHPEPILTNLNTKIRKGSLVIVSGDICTGKSTFLEALIGSAQILAGTCVVNGREAGNVAYAPQLPQRVCFLDSSIRANILFGETEMDLDVGALNIALEGSGLANDMNDPHSTLHESRDLTPVGPQGSALSGGQKAGVFLARAIYAKHAHGADTLILDDPFPALDNKNKQMVWKGGVLGAMAGSTRILVMNSQLMSDFASDADQLILLSGGACVYDGRPEEIPNDVINKLGHEYKTHGKKAPQSQMVGTTAAHRKLLRGKFRAAVQATRFRGRIQNVSSRHAVMPPPLEPVLLGRLTSSSPHLDHEHLKQPEPVDVKTIDKAAGGPSTAMFSVVWTIMRNCGMVQATVCVTVILQECGPPLEQWWNGVWASGGFGLSAAGYVGVALGIAVARISCSFVASMAKNSAKANLTKVMYSSLEAKIDHLSQTYYYWKHGQPSDNENPDQFYDVTSILNLVLKCLVTVLVVLWKAPMLTPFVLASYWLLAWSGKPVSWGMDQALRGGLGPSRRKLDRHVQEAFDLRGSVRAQNAVSRFQLQYDQHAYLMLYYIAIWWGAHVLGQLYAFVYSAVFKVLAIGVVMASRGPGTGAQAAAIYAMVCSLEGAIQQLRGTIQNVASSVVEWDRLETFLRDECDEGGAADGDRQLIPSDRAWPVHGRIEFRDCCFRYDPKDASTEALRNLNYSIPPGVKVGVIGRRGSGKSTFANLLLSVADLYSGEVLVDGESLAHINRRSLRQRIGLVPQTPIIFKGSIRDNLVPMLPEDPERSHALRHDDERILRMLENFHLLGVVQAKGGLDAEITSDDLSAGEQQLLCAVRALVPEPNILILDEATASLDFTSADFVQETIYQNFTGTVINIAHHMHFVEDADQVLCMHNGAIEDVGTPAELAAKPDSHYAQQLRAATAAHE